MKVGTIRKIETWHLDFALNGERQRNETCFKQAYSKYLFFSFERFQDKFLRLIIWCDVKDLYMCPINVENQSQLKVSLHIEHIYKYKQ